MNAKKGSWPSVIFKVLLVAALIPVRVWTYNILMIPLPIKSHASSMVVIADNLANRGHKVTILIGENFRLTLFEFRNQTEVSVVRYADMTDGVNMDYDAHFEHHMKSLIEFRNNTKHANELQLQLYVHFMHSVIAVCLHGSLSTH